ncbi:MAG: hypothetical protein IPL61_05915 [Myxococcales bacterium]|nr:hypothetical protein [Myxococcales bacterium]
MLPCAHLRLPDGAVVVAAPGAVLGRSYTVDVRIDDGRVSEVHGYVSLRGSQLVLLALRGRIRCEGRDTPRLELRAGQQIELAPEVVVEVVTVTLPQEVLALEADGVARQVLLGVTSVVTRPAPHLVIGYVSEAAALVWSDGLAWRVRVGKGSARPLRAGATVTVDGVGFRAIAVAAVEAAAVETVPLRNSDRLRIISAFESVQVWREGAPQPCVLGGRPARLIAELLALGGPVRWETLAAELWHEDVDPSTLRHRLDITLMKTRRLLASAGIRRDLVTSHRNGWIELLLYPGDVADDRG